MGDPESSEKTQKVTPYFLPRPAGKKRKKKKREREIEKREKERKKKRKTRNNLYWWQLVETVLSDYFTTYSLLRTPSSPVSELVAMSIYSSRSEDSHSTQPVRGTNL